MMALEQREANTTVLALKVETGNKRKCAVQARTWLRNTEFPKQGIKSELQASASSKENEHMEIEDIVTLTEGMQSLQISNPTTDERNSHNPFMVTEYISDIYKYLKELEAQNPANHHYLDQQPAISSKMRGVLVDWMILVHLRFRLLPETLFLSVAIMDRFLEGFITTKEQLQLIGVASMLIASKYEEVHYPDLFDFSYITADSYSEDEILQMERMILRSLGYRLSYPAPITFLRRFSRIAEVTSEEHTMAKFLIELSLTDYLMLEYSASHTAASALCLSLWMFKPLKPRHWSKVLEDHSGYTEPDLKMCMIRLAKLVIKMPLSKLQAVPQKYSNSRYLKVAKSLKLYSGVIQSLAAVPDQEQP